MNILVGLTPVVKPIKLFLLFQIIYKNISSQNVTEVTVFKGERVKSLQVILISRNRQRIIEAKCLENSLLLKKESDLCLKVQDEEGGRDGEIGLMRRRFY